MFGSNTICNGPDPPLADIASLSFPFRGIARRLTDRPVSDSDTICNDPDPPLADIVLFGLSLGEDFHTLIKILSSLGFPSRL